MSVTNELIYFGDPMCSWCWGISENFTKLKEKYEGQMRVRIVMGGLRPGNVEIMDDKLKSFLKHHWEEVNKASGQPFSYDLMERDDFVYDTEPPSRAVVAVREMDESRTWDFFSSIQRAFYAQSRDTNEIDTYLDLLAETDLDADVFSEKYNSAQLKKDVWKDFAYAREMGINGFPAVVMRQEEKFYLITHGYTTFGQMDGKVATVLQKALE